MFLDDKITTEEQTLLQSHLYWQSVAIQLELAWSHIQCRRTMK